MSKEIRIGILSLLTIAVCIWGFQYLKGKNFLKKNYSFEVVYPDVEGLDVASPVEINGLTVGAISSIEVNPEDVRSMIVKFDIEGEFFLPKNTVALYSAGSLVGGKKIVLDYDEVCKGNDCLVGGERLTPGVRGMLASMVSEGELSEFFGSLRGEIGPVMDTMMNKLTSEEADNTVSNSLKSMEESMKNLASLTSNMDRLLKRSYDNLDATIANMAVVTESFATTKDDLENMITNLSTFTDQIVDADLGGTMAKASSTMDNTNELLEGLKSTVTQANESFENVNTLLSKMDQGEGTIAKLLADPEIYNNLEATSRHLSLLLQDLRLNPKRYVRLSVFGRKGNEYVPPEEDPAFELRQAPIDDN